MIFKKTNLDGEYIILPEKLEDERGYFARVFSMDEFAKLNLNTKWVQNNTFFSKKRGTLRGLVYQEKPKEEVKLIRCTRGEIYDIAVDLRRNSKTFHKFTGIVLSHENGYMHYIPKGFAHGYITQKDETEVLYQVSEFYSPERAKGVRWDDPSFAIKWPTKPEVISEKDNSYPDYK
ncbi:dTDP-4-dehydrorhamnose 3,5-epimerase [Candidatus Woesebacteria bacterium RIFCSPLOWO2_01_FULL_39_61]|uniref:dTDP-4-dehydrorhamnose 3,5-epimerase n=1 Tax=Candidatus Woesebacteria bacterium RIFCSPHIGHO2_02_FULL_39_13 TaxID=1802505 RepID=A0A1F7Z2Y2_9BACT|nr:MAG: dTDP-4-dehydrorhamnose 3,5-epimerase [Candidatus Woesebacteria bacterium RIFCSPHIGHO2_01_FULL_39_95]OGM33824.1 MAG: dTDP-4-dehydrorhamnose 3,5-epimerase [Candidatus Woesebacteria bacterium RIFCSPHIGHO2_02_FULL_39_13]OGM38985.1 MAG: dTDP-4-dehydrorhamnose 3,5-epimerase [Candidatus Woesebacteria bacterium RIFCSPHIGHO2_12_FULL_40_20]OGM67490.1 MAG: dTDP-4-dehydrorhamnose 3,5-epimerase [Candidatus Woesebacteria bacterium RIFCSPLOWO2_01_FULL_39_61]OGM72821.1 MAG: dTDP-4-dehydrorhamnose 3,5-e